MIRRFVIACALLVSACATPTVHAGLIERDPAKWCASMGYAVVVMPDHVECLAPGEHE